MTPEQIEQLIPSMTSCEERGPRLVGPHGGLRGELPNPTERDLSDPVFEAIWQATKTWDVNVPEHYIGYCGMNGSHVMLILNAIRAAQLESNLAAVRAEVERLVPVGWQYRYVCGEDGLGPWRFTADEDDAAVYERHVGYEIRRVFALAAKEPKTENMWDTIGAPRAAKEPT